MALSQSTLLYPVKYPAMGFVERDELYRRYGEAEIHMAPSRWESFGLVIR